MRRLNGYGPSLIVLFTAMLVLFLGPSTVERLAFVETQARMVQASRSLEANDVLEQLNAASTNIAEFVEPSVVHISATHAGVTRRGARIPGHGGGLSTGSGWIYDEDGHVVTNLHVIEGADEIEVQLSSGLLRPAELVGSDESTDIAVLKIDPGQLHAATRRDPRAEPVLQGELVYAFGSPFDFRFSMSSGIVSGKGRSVGIIGGSSYENFIQVDAAINPGNSGGPLTDRRGRVIGMNTAIATGRRGALGDEDQDFAGIGLAIPMEMIEPVVNQLIEKGVVEKGLIGVRVRELDRAIAQEYGFVGDGVIITDITPNGAADRAGVRPGDVVHSVNGTTVGSVQQLRSIISSMLPGETVTLEVVRPDDATRTVEPLTIEVRLDRLNLLRDMGMVPPDQDPTRMPEVGIALMATATEALAAEQGVPFVPGVMVLRSVPGSTLEAVAPGSVIIDVAGYPVMNVEQFLDVLRGFNLLDTRTRPRATVRQPDGSTLPLRIRVQ